MTPKELALQKLAQMKPEFAMRAQLQNEYNAEMANKYTRDIIPFSQWLAARNQSKAKGGAVHNQDVMHLAIGGQGPKNWLKGSIDPVINPLKQNLMSGRDPTEVLKELQEQYSPEDMQKLSENTRAHVERSMQSVGRMHSMNQWVERNLANYIRKQMGTHEDPIRKLAEEGIVHIAPEQVGRNRHQAPSHRVKHGAEALGKSEEAKAWEDSSDVAMNPMKVGDILKDEGLRLTLGEPWMEKADPNTNIFKPTSNMTADALGFDHIVDVLKQDLAEGRIRPEQLNKISIEQAVRRTHEYNQDLAAKMNASRAAAREGLPVHKEYPEGYRWIELNKPGSFNAESEAMGHSVKGYEPPKGHPDWVEDSGNAGSLNYGHGGWEGIKSGKAKVYSLVDAKGEPHVTIETKTKGVLNDNDFGENDTRIVEGRGEFGEQGYKTSDNQFFESYADAVDHEKMIQKPTAEELKQPPSITQIKGKQNRAPKKDYLPYVQDFVRSGKWSDVGDLKNTGLIRKSDLIDKFSPDELDSIGVGEYLTKAEQDKLLLRALRPPEQNKAHGGIIHKALGGNVQPSLTQMKMALAQKGNSVNLKNVGANEAPNMLPKHYFPPDGNSNGSIPAPGGVATPNGMPIGGVDMSQQQGGHQLAPQQQITQPPAQPAQPPQGQPPQNQPDGQQGTAPAPQGAPMGNMLQMTPQGQTMAALGGGQPQKLAKGGQPKKNKAPQEKALEQARLNAIRLLGLHENNTPEERAKALGFIHDYMHGTERLDRFLSGKAPDPKRATSGPMPFGTDSPVLASSYAAGKPDTSRISSDEGDIQHYFQVSPKQLGIQGRSPISVERSYHYLKPEQKALIAANAKNVGYENPEEATGKFVAHPEPGSGITSPQHYDYVLNKEAGGNPLKALRILFHDSGALFGSEHELEDVFKAAGYPHEISQTNAPWTSAKGVMLGKMKSQNPLDTSNSEYIMNKVIPHLEKTFAKDRTKKQNYGADAWAKQTRFTPKEWVNQLKEDVSKGENSYVWTSIPDKITTALQGLGHDSILDTGGKKGGQRHQVAIPFAPEQLRSKFAAYDPERLNEKNLLAAKGGKVKPKRTVVLHNDLDTMRLEMTKRAK